MLQHMVCFIYSMLQLHMKYGRTTGEKPYGDEKYKQWDLCRRLRLAIS